jgi:hypothetical protein
MLFGIGTFLKTNVLKPDHILLTLKSLKDRRSTISLPKFSQIDLLENFPMPKVYQGSMIDDMFNREKINILTLLDFPDPEKAHRHRLSRVFHGFCQCPGDRLFPEYSWRITHANQLHLLLMSMVHRRSIISVTMWPLIYLHFSTPNTSALVTMLAVDS